MATLKQLVTDNKLKTNYPDWQQLQNPVAGPGEPGGLDPDDTQPKKQNFWKTFFSKAKETLLSGVINTGGQTNAKYFGEDPEYTAGDEEIRNSGRSVESTDIQRRFRMGNEWGAQSFNEVFVDGFEDPTFLTFKIEFGEWGASVSDNSTIQSVQKESLYSNTWNMDYDDMPMGLLNLNFMNTGDSFNDQQTYNAYNFLMNRNEDRRAKYLKDFVEGLYTIQRDFPYMFQKINGVDKLGMFDSKLGQRLKDCVLKLTCVSDSLDMKMRTLLELYRKAAWDDIYQRWQLPDIHRYFKMIIYVFDHRALAMGNGILSPDNDYLPMIAYECGPCEFVIDSHEQSELSVNYNDLKVLEPTIDIRVHNVRTFYANKMFQRVKFVNDMWTAWQHEGFGSADVSAGQVIHSDDVATNQDGRNFAWQYVWLQRMFVQPDEYSMGAVWDPEFQYRAKQHYHGDPNDDEFMMTQGAAATIDQEMDSTWHFATVSDQGYIIRNFSDLWGAVRDIVTSRTQLIRDSRQSNRYYFVNDLTRIDQWAWLARQNLLEIDVEGARGDVMRHIRNMIRSLNNYALIYTAPDSSLNDPKYEFNEEKQEEVYETIITGEEVPSQTMTKIDKNLLKSDQDMTDLLLNLDRLYMDMTELDPDLSHLEQTLTEIDMFLLKPEQQLTEIDLNLLREVMDLTHIELNPEHAPVEMVAILKNLVKERMLMTYIEKNLDHMEQALTYIVKELSKPMGDMTAILQNLRKMMGPLTYIHKELSKPMGDMTELEFNLKKYDGPLTDLLLNLEQLSQQMAQLDIDLSKSPQDLVLLDQDLSKALMDMIQLILNLSHDGMTLQEIIKNLDKADMDMTQLDPDLSRLIQQLTEIVPYLDKDDMQMTEIVMNLRKLQQQLAEIISDDYRFDMTEVPLPLQTGIPEQTMMPQDYNTDKAVEPMSAEIENTTIPHQLMQPQDYYDKDESKEPMVPLDDNNRKPDMKMSGQIVDTIIEGSDQMVSLTDDSSIASVPMSSLTESVSEKHAPMTGLDASTVTGDMLMTPQDTQSETGDMLLHHLSPDTERSDMKMTEMSRETDFVTNPMSGLVNPNELPGQKMEPLTDTEVEHTLKDICLESSETPELKMSRLEETDVVNELQRVELDGAERSDMLLSKLYRDTEAPEMNFARLDNDNEHPDMRFVRLEEQYELNRQPMSGLLPEDELQHDPMVRLDKDTDVSHDPMSELADDDKTPYEIHDSEVKEDEEEQEQREEQQKKQMSGATIIDNEDIARDVLARRIEMLRNLDTESLENASFEQLNKLVGLLEDTVNQVNRNMKMTQLEARTSRGTTMRMTSIQQEERSQFMSRKTIDVADGAYERAEKAYQRAHDNKRKIK